MRPTAPTRQAAHWKLTGPVLEFSCVLTGGLGFTLLAWLACLYNARQDRLVLWSLIGGAIMVSCLAVAYQSGDLHPPLNY